MPPQTENQYNIPAEKPKRSQAFLLVLTAILFATGIFGVWFFNTLLPQIDAEDEVVPVKTQFADWKTYRNEEYGFEFKYPQNLEEYASNNTNFRIDRVIGDDEKEGWEEGEFAIEINVIPKSSSDADYQNTLNDAEEIYFSGRKAYVGFDLESKISPYGPYLIFIPNGDFVYRIALYPNTIGSDAKKLTDQILSTFKFIK